MIGKTISHYKIIEKIGEGGMGVVYKAEDTKLKRIVALKFLPSETLVTRDEQSRFTREAQAAATLNHSNIATIHEIDEDNGQLFIAMEYIDGQELKEKLKSGPLSINNATNLAYQIAEGLQTAHEKGIIHRDIKSSNIMITDKGQVKILDFGLAKFRGSPQLTKTGTTVGTVAYMSPEQARGEDVDQRTDIWSFGIVLYEMLTGQLPFTGDYEQAVIYSILNAEPKPISLVNSSVSLQLEEIVVQSLAKNLDERFQNTDELLVNLKAIGDQHKGVDGNVTVSQKKETKRKTPYFYAGIAVIIVLITLMGILFFPKKEKGITISAIAVLPFSNTKPDIETDYFGFAIADQIIGDLIYLKNITVRPSSSIRKYEKQAIDPVKVGSDLNVNYVLTGNYLREADIIRLNVELVDVNTNEMVWREPIEVDYHNAFELQDIVAQKVVKGLNVQFSQKELNRIGKDIPDNPLAYEYYLRSISYPLSNEGDQLAIEMLNKSIEIDSNFAPAYDQLGDRIHRLTLYGMRDPKEFQHAENYYLKALILNEEFLNPLGNLAMLYAETDRTYEAMELTRQMLEINPNNVDAHYALGYIYRYAGMLNESVQEMEKAVTSDPNNPEFRSIMFTYLAVGDYEKVFELFDNYKESAFTFSMLGYALFRQGNNEQAVEKFNRVIAIEPDGISALMATCVKTYIEGNVEEGLVVARKIEDANSADAEAWYGLAGNYGLLGERDGSVRALQRAVDGGYFNYPFMLTDLCLDSVRDDPEFQKVLQEAKEKHLAFRKRFF
jgi:TolB-like protein/tRNA A-37 threonylcarbamoyl transferase component Bud32/Flp pilus assembly protein TadD